MYEHFFGFSQKPFNVTPDPKFLFMTESHQEALSSLLYGIEERRGFISVSGEVGTGKTTLLHYLLSILDRKNKAIFIFNTNISFEDLLKEILRNLALRAFDANKISMIRKLNLYLLKTLERDENVAILIDEAQNLSNEVLEELRMLSNMETDKAKLMQIVLVGQPELEKKLDSAGLRQLKQRIGIRRQIRPLTEEESRQYIDDRLQKMGSKSEDIFTPDALDLICRYSTGIFRKINIICDNAFLIGYALKKKPIGTAIVREVFEDMGIQAPRERFQTQKLYTAEQAIYNHYQKDPVFTKSETPKGKQQPIPSHESGGRIVSRSKRIGVLSLLALLALGVLVYLGWAYFLNPPSSPGSNPRDESRGGGQDRFKRPSPDFKLKPSSDSPNLHSIFMIPAAFQSTEFGKIERKMQTSNGRIPGVNGAGQEEERIEKSLEPSLERKRQTTIFNLGPGDHSRMRKYPGGNKGWLKPIVL